MPDSATLTAQLVAAKVARQAAKDALDVAIAAVETANRAFLDAAATVNKIRDDLDKQTDQEAGVKKE